MQNVQKLRTATLAGANPPPETTESTASTAQSTPTTQTATEETTQSSTTEEATQSSTTEETNRTPAGSWTPPKPPNGSPQKKADDRITDGEFINTVKASDGSGYTDFDVRVGANTWMKNVDPPKDESGEPYFIAKINGKLIARTDVVPFRKQGSFMIPIPAAALKQFNSGTLKIRIMLLDTDHSHDDLYGTWTMTIKYSNN